MKTRTEREPVASRSTADARGSTSPAAQAPGEPNRKRVLMTLAGLLVAAVVVVVAVLVLRDDGGRRGQTADVAGQGGEGELLAADGALLERAADGLWAELDVPRPQPGSYDYPAADNLPETAAPHPVVSAGASDAPEVFTLWMFVFNHPDLCTDATCDVDDLGSDAAAAGGVFQVDGRIADDTTLQLMGRVRTGQRAPNGVVLERPLDAEVHLAVAPHGRYLGGEDGWRQLNGPLGNPEFWWAATFRPE